MLELPDEELPGYHEVTVPPLGHTVSQLIIKTTQKRIIILQLVKGSQPNLKNFLRILIQVSRGAQL